jgi:hypothetical protein
VKVQGLNERWPLPSGQKKRVSLVVKLARREREGGIRTAKVHFLHEVSDFLRGFNVRDDDAGASCIECCGEAELIAFGYAADDHGVAFGMMLRGVDTTVPY